jgi:hypothetical protein
MWLNNFPVANGIFTTWSRREIIFRHWLNYTHHFCTPFGAYCEVHEENTPTNNITTHVTPAISLGPTGNFQGTYNFLSLVTGQVIQCHHFDEVPVPDAVIARVSELAKHLGIARDLVFADRHRVPFDWLDESFQAMADDPIAAYPDIPADMPGVQLDCLPATPSTMATTTTTTTSDPDWAQLAEEAIHLSRQQ